MNLIPSRLKKEYQRSLKVYPYHCEPVITLDEFKLSTPYFVCKLNKYQQRLKQFCHHGQRKLLIGELLHLSSVLTSFDEPALVIYAGAASGNHLPILGELFPNVKFICVDPNEFNLKYDLSKTQYSNHHNCVYMSVDPANKNMYKENGKKIVNHYKGKLDSDKLNEYTGYEDDFVDFIINSNYQFYLMEEYFDIETAKLMNHLIKEYKGKSIFWSDIRTNFIDNKYPTDTDIIINSACMINWIKYMIEGIDNFYAMFKFRTTYGRDINWNVADKFVNTDYKKDFIESGELQFFQGTRYLQAWQGYTSSETRMWCTLEQLKLPLIRYELAEHENKCFAYNRLFRYTHKCYNPYADLVRGFDHCNDCAFEARVWKAYSDLLKISEYKKREKIKFYLIKICNVLGNHIDRYPHGNFFN